MEGRSIFAPGVQFVEDAAGCGRRERQVAMAKQCREQRATSSGRPKAQQPLQREVTPPQGCPHIATTLLAQLHGSCQPPFTSYAGPPSALAHSIFVSTQTHHIIDCYLYLS